MLPTNHSIGHRGSDGAVSDAYMPISMTVPSAVHFLGNLNQWKK